MEQQWQSLAIDEVVDRFAGHDLDWWIAGGVAIDLFLGWESRPHDDLDLEMFRSNREVLFDVFEGWELFTVSEGVLARWTRGRPIDPTVFGIWARPSSDSPWAVEVMLADGDEHEWRFRRDPTISLPRERLTRMTRTGLVYCTPEVQLLYKAKQNRPKDDIDFTRCLHLMTHSQKAWLRDAVAQVEPSHPWVVGLEMATREISNTQ